VEALAGSEGEVSSPLMSKSHSPNTCAGPVSGLVVSTNLKEIEQNPTGLSQLQSPPGSSTSCLKKKKKSTLVSLPSQVSEERLKQLII